MKKLSLILIGLLALLPSSLFAISNPDALEIKRVMGYANAIEGNFNGTNHTAPDLFYDLLVVVMYNIDYATIPTESAEDTYICRFLRGSEELNSAEIVPFNNKGYGLGVCSFYWTAIERASDSVEHGDPNGEAYEVCVQGKPTAFADPPKICTTTITWRDAQFTEDLLRADVIDLAEDLEADPKWVANNQDLIQFVSGNVSLTRSGEEYFGRAIPNLASMVPLLFGSSTTNPLVDERGHVKSLNNSLQTFWDNTAVGTFFTSTGNFFQVQKIVISTLLAFMAIAVIVWITSQFAQSFEFGLLAACIATALFIVIGWISLVVGAIIVFIAILAIGWAFFLRRAG